MALATRQSVFDDHLSAHMPPWLPENIVDYQEAMHATGDHFCHVPIGEG